MDNETLKSKIIEEQQKSTFIQGFWQIAGEFQILKISLNSWTENWYKTKDNTDKILETLVVVKNRLDYQSRKMEELESALEALKKKK